MAWDRTDQNDPAAEQPATERAVRPLRPDEVRSSLMARLGPVVDRIRQLPAKFGLRPYRVFLVHILWSGAKIGEGDPREVSRTEILPTPRIRDVSSTSEVFSAFGRVEEGGVVIDRISPRFSEDDLMGATPDLLDPAAPRTGLRNAEFFWEVVEQRPGRPNPVPRSYTVAAAPTLMRGQSHWRVSLIKRMVNRSRQQTSSRVDQ